MSDRPVILTSDDVAERIADAAPVVAECRAAVRAAHDGVLLTPPRAHTPLGDGRIAYTAGRVPGRWFGYRSYDTFTPPGGDQLVVVHDDTTGRLAGLALGEYLGQARTGAIGGVAVDALAAPDASTVGLVGTGAQAWMQLWAIAAVRPIGSVSVYSRSAERRERFARNATERYGFDVRAADSAEDAVADKDVVVLATGSERPVVDADAIAADAFVTTLGPKQVGHSEFDAALAARAATIVTDSLAQTTAYDPPFVLAGTPHADRMISLGAALADPPAGPTLFCSVGLAGTEAWLLASWLGL